MSDSELITTPCVFGENGGFLLERELGRGGMGGVYLGRDKMLDRPVAVKVMLKEYGSDAEFLEKFRREAQAAARLIHPNIAQIYSFGISDGMPYIAMELVAGGSLYSLMSNKEVPTDVSRVMKICEQTAQALRCAADSGLVHGDVKPENILLDSNGNAKLVDFGLAAMQKDTSEIWGTPYYIAPEKVRKEPVDFRADMYSLGGTLYHALCGTAPFEGEDANAVVRRRFEVLPLKPSQVRPGLSPLIDKLVMKMLAFDPKDRYPSFEALLEDFKNVMANGLGKAGPAAPSAPSKPSAGHGGRKVVLKVRHGGGRIAAPSAGAGDDDGPARSQAPGAQQARGGFAPKIKLADEENYEDEEGSVGGKIALVAGGIVLAVALVGAILYGVVKLNDSSNASAGQAQIEQHINEAKASLSKTRQTVEHFGKQVEDMAKAIAKDCEEVTADAAKAMKGAFPDEMVAALKPPKSKELRKAEDSLKPKDAKQAEKDDEAAKKALKQKAEKEAAKAVASEKPVSPKDQRSADDEDAMQANDPEKAAALEAAAKEAAAKAGAASAAALAAKESAAKAKAEVPEILRVVNELWEKNYAAQAAALRIKKKVTDICAGIDTASIAGGTTKGESERLAKATVDFTSMFEELKISQDVTTVQKAKGSIKDRGERVVKKTARRIYEQKQQAKREKEKAEREAAEKKRLEKEAREQAERAKNEVAAAKEKFLAANSNGNFRLLDWNGARRMLAGLETKTGEGYNAVKHERRKIDMMESVHAILARNLKGYVFTRGAGKVAGVQIPHLKGMEVIDVDVKKGLTLRRQGAHSGQKTVTWQNFYRDYHANLSEVCNKYIMNGRENGNPKLSMKEQCEAMVGIAFTMRLLFPDDTSALAYGEKMAKKAVKHIPEFKVFAIEAYPDADYSGGGDGN